MMVIVKGEGVPKREEKSVKRRRGRGYSQRSRTNDVQAPIPYRKKTRLQSNVRVPSSYSCPMPVLRGLDDEERAGNCILLFVVFSPGYSHYHGHI